MYHLVALILAVSPPALPVLHGTDALREELRSHPGPTVLHFWATWCPGCLEEIPEIRRLSQEANQLGVEVLFVSLDDPSKAGEVATLMEEKGLLPSAGARAVVLDAPDPGPVAAMFDAKWTGQLPATFFLLNSDTVVASHLGATPVDSLLRDMRARLGSKKPSGSKSPSKGAPQ